MADEQAVWNDEDYLAQLNMPYVRGAGAAVADVLRKGRVCEFAYQPGDMTRYKLVFAEVGISPIMDTPPIEYERRPGAADVLNPVGAGVFSPHEQENGYVLVSWLEHGAYPFQLQRAVIHHAGYVSGKFNHCPYASGVALAALFQAICDAGGVG
jgi:hypothetical protein